ncbi:hypothetical protein MC7420_1291 [Coleofasciculus chthonoplastes PCC 7420]|uniref:Uncharacterized protein n=1 Tax=Coleofasciculus chthonoplastes PCC 7420 TaxID=118168 RepID=B4VRK9_9CYAN|nr:hypothetical protein [Coleofasciculus chthonoplastes]EDX75373.1 hypothetical protein MC7420_1291 [Coleofasciculus chthonoplastes PCC 7420]
MLNGDLKKKALAKLEATDKEYQTVATDVTKRAAELYEKRKATAEQVIQACEEYVNTLANSPKEFDNAEIAEKANEEAATIKAKTATLKAAKEEIAKLLTLTQQHADGVNTRLNFLKIDAPNNYQHLLSTISMNLMPLCCLEVI